MQQLNGYRLVAGLTLLIQMAGCDATQVAALPSAAIPKPSPSMSAGLCQSFPRSVPLSPFNASGNEFLLFNATCGPAHYQYLYGDGTHRYVTGIGAYGSILAGTSTNSGPNSIVAYCLSSDVAALFQDWTCFSGPPLSTTLVPVPVYISSSPIPNAAYSQMRSYVQRRLRTAPPFRLRSSTAAMGDRG